MFLKSFDDIPQFIAGDKTILKEILHPKNDSIPINYSIAHAIVEVGNASLPHTLKSSEVYYILEGTGLMHINGAQKSVKQGDVFYVPPMANQHIVNTGDKPLFFLCIVEPYWQEEEEEIL